MSQNKVRALTQDNRTSSQGADDQDDWEIHGQGVYHEVVYTIRVGALLILLDAVHLQEDMTLVARNQMAYEGGDDQTVHEMDALVDEDLVSADLGVHILEMLDVKGNVPFPDVVDSVQVDLYKVDKLWSEVM